MRTSLRLILLLIHAVMVMVSAYASEPVTISGKVTDAVTGEAIRGIIVKGKSGFASTSADGAFHLNLKAPVDSISFRGMGYESLVLAVTSDFSDVKMMPKATLLNDVIVEAPDIYARGDTLVFNVSRYANARDNAIIDVIKRLPGIKVEDDGTIKYQGKPINKFYLDGNDFIGGQYGLATNNISHKDVASVEVMEHHQPVKALEGIEFPEEAGINLKLKDDARDRWVGVAQAAAGIQPFLYDASLFTMRMARKVQNMFTVKADNTGWNPANEIKDHDFDSMFSTQYVASLWPEYISADIVDAPLSEKRTRDNLSWLANAITAWKSGDTSMRLRLDYIGDRLAYESGLATEYFSPQIPDFIQNNQQRTRRNDLSAQLYSETNKRGYYLKEKLTVSAENNKSISDVTGSFDLHQRVDRKNLNVTNDLKLVKRNEKKLFTLISRNSFVRRPDLLSISGEEDAMQSLSTSDFRSTTETSVGKLTRFWKFYLNGGLDIAYRRMNSALAGVGVYDNSGVHTAFLSNLYASPQVDYDRNGWRASLGVPVKWLHYSVCGQHDYLNLSPRLSVRRQLGARSELSGSVAYRLGSPSAYLNIDVPVLADYHNLFIGTNPDRYSHDLSASASYSYRNPLKSLFVSVTASYDYHRTRIMTDQLFADDLIVTTFSNRLSRSGTGYLRGTLSKGLGHSKMVVGIEADASTSSASSMRDGAVIPFRQNAVGVKPYFRGSLVRWLSLDYSANYGWASLKLEGEDAATQSFHQNLFVTLIPDDRLNFTVGAEHFLTAFPEGNVSNLVLLDATAVWKLNSKIRLSLTANNLLGRRSYEYVTYGTISRREHHFRLRPRTILASLQLRF